MSYSKHPVVYRHRTPLPRAALALTAFAALGAAGLARAALMPCGGGSQSDTGGLVAADSPSTYNDGQP